MSKLRWERRPYHDLGCHYSIWMARPYLYQLAMVTEWHSNKGNLVHYQDSPAETAKLTYAASVNGRPISPHAFATPEAAMIACEEVLLDSARAVVEQLAT